MQSKWLFFLGLLIDLYGLVVSVLYMMTEQLNGAHGFNNPGFLWMTVLFLLLAVAGGILRIKGRQLWSVILVWIPALLFLFYGLYTVLFP